MTYIAGMKILIVILLVAVLAALAGAGVLMLRRPGTEGARKDGMAKALALRVALSIGAFVLVLLAWWMGWIQPTGIPISA